MKRITTSILAMGLAALFGCSTWEPMCPDNGFAYRICPQGTTRNASTDMAARLAALEKERQRLDDEWAAAKKEKRGPERPSKVAREPIDRSRSGTGLASIR